MWTKICGVQSEADALAIARLGPSAIGLNFHPPSPRCVEIPTAEAICRRLGDGTLKVGVCVEQTPADIRDLVTATGIDIVQLHGDYPAETVLELRDIPFIWVHRLGPAGLEPLREACAFFVSEAIMPYACLIDARVQGMFGGSGVTVDWALLAREYDRQQFPPLILAGGLTPDNVAEAIAQVRPFGVDVASGVETEGEKNLALCERFLDQAAFAASQLL